MFVRGGRPCQACHLWACKCADGSSESVQTVAPDCETDEPAEFTPADDRKALAEAIGHLSYTAQRQFPRVGNEQLQTPWDLDHARINELLTLWELA